ncbi:MAG: hypothetical protein IK050_05455, partial [Lachnospiraceae bacterium]|nr:hypothetical protein [Lachnospiraceae bacterium]
MNYKKMLVWVILVAIIACIIVAICFMTDQKNSNIEADDIQNNAEVEDTDVIPEEWENCGVDYYFDGTNYVVDGDMVFKYKKKLVGRMHAARYDTMYIVLTNNPDITHEEVALSLYGSGAEDRLTDTIIIGMHVLDDNGNILSSNPIGLTMSIENLTDKGFTLVFEQSGGNATGHLETGTGFGIQMLNDDGEWEDMGEELELAFSNFAHNIEINSKTELNYNWEGIYEKLKPGY